MDSIDAPSPPSQSHTGHPRHFYLAVDRLQFKMQTWVDLLDLVGRRPCLPIVVCCSTRDDLDSLCSSLSPLPFISSSALYSDLGEDERAFVIEKFRQVATRWSQINHAGAGNEDEVGKDDRSRMIIVTDACLPLLASGEPPMNAHLLINYELPAKKETYGRRLAACLAADGIVINMVVGGEVVTLKSIEEGTGIVMQEMPMQLKTGWASSIVVKHHHSRGTVLGQSKVFSVSLINEENEPLYEPMLYLKINCLSAWCRIRVNLFNLKLAMQLLLVVACSNKSDGITQQIYLALNGRV